MTKISDLTSSERKVYDACHNGWFVSGEYRAVLGGHERRFRADSLRLLFGDVNRWFKTHERRHGSDHLLVKCVRAA